MGVCVCVTDRQTDREGLSSAHTRSRGDGGRSSSVHSCSSLDTGFQVLCWPADLERGWRRTLEGNGGADLEGLWVEVAGVSTFLSKNPGTVPRQRGWHRG